MFVIYGAISRSFSHFFFFFTFFLNFFYSLPFFGKNRKGNTRLSLRSNSINCIAGELNSNNRLFWLLFVKSFRFSCWLKVSLWHFCCCCIFNCCFISFLASFWYIWIRKFQIKMISIFNMPYTSHMADVFALINRESEIHSENVRNWKRNRNIWIGGGNDEFVHLKNGSHRIHFRFWIDQLVK